MSISYEWKIENIENYPKEDISSDGYYTINWRLNAEEDGILSSVYGSNSIEYDSKSVIIKYSDLTEELAVSILIENLGESEIEHLKNAVADKINSKRQTPSDLPWK